ncbi:PhoH family protein [Magnetospirillum molischianum]|nr:PhoH family protein [Magnetospirillum molischianum]
MKQRQAAPRGKNGRGLPPLSFEDMPAPPVRASKKPFGAMNEAQGHYLSTIDVNTIAFGLGPAGTGKTYCSVGAAAEAFRAGETRKLIFTRPAVEAAEESMGYLPGELDEKFAPYFAPVREVLNERLGQSRVDYEIQAGKIVALPLPFMRGHTFKDAWVIFDEAQNATPSQMKLFLTRIGEPVKVIIEGDLDQMDIEGPSGLEDAIRRLRHIKGVGAYEFTEDDIVRSGFCREIVKAYRKAA